MIALMLITAVCLVFLSGLVVSQGINRLPNRALLLSIFLLGTWTMMIFGLQTEYGYHLEYSRAVFAIGAWSLLSLVWFVSALLSLEGRTRFILKTALIASAGIALILCMSSLVITDVLVPQDIVTMPVPQYGELMPAYIGLILGAIVLIVYMIIRGSLREAEYRRRQQIRVVGGAISLAIAIGVITNLIIPWLLGNTQSALFVTVSILILMMGLSHAIIRHGLFDIKLAAVRTFGYALTSVILAIVYIGSAYIISLVFLRQPEEKAREPGLEIVNVTLALILAFIFQPVKRFFDKLTDGIFYRDAYDSESFYSRLSEVLTSDNADLKDLMHYISSEIQSTLKAEHVFLYVQSGRHHAMAGTKGHSDMSGADLKDLAVSLSERAGNIILRRELPDKDSLCQLLLKNEIAVVVPLMQKDTLLGCLFLGGRRSGEYTDRDIKVLETISNELAIAIQNALSVQEIKEINDTLQQRIEEATRELRSSNEQLRRLDAAKDEFVSMASHQLRTPLTSVKGYISMVLEGDAGKISPMQKQLLEEAFMSSERMVHLISDFLNVSRLQTGKFVIEKTFVNLADIVEQEVDGLMPTAEAHSLKIRYRKPSHFPSLYIDEGKLHQVVMNFIDNAIYYSKEHTVIAVRLTMEDGDAVLRVVDTGIGVPKSEQARLFTKFFRAGNARRQRPDGTGIGLFLAKMVITAHGGSMVFESVEGEGSTFGFRLPIKKLSEMPAEEAQPVESALEK